MFYLHLSEIAAETETEILFYYSIHSALRSLFISQVSGFGGRGGFPHTTANTMTTVQGLHSKLVVASAAGTNSVESRSKLEIHIVHQP